MRAMRRQDREITDPEKINAVIDACVCCRLGFCDQGKAYIVPVSFGHTMKDGRHVFYFHGAPEGRKIDLIRETGWAGIEMDEGYQLHRAERACGYSAAVRSIIGGGRISFVETAEEKRKALNSIMAHTAGGGGWDFPEAALRTTCVYKLEAEELSCKEHL